MTFVKRCAPRGGASPALRRYFQMLRGMVSWDSADCLQTHLQTDRYGGDIDVGDGVGKTSGAGIQIELAAARSMKSRFVRS